ncbi:MAG: NADP-dependent malic enzyme [Thermacetogeniaceae bacterium]|jgi:malate dehydrogenase (oxaloacetate-decarboxylating)|nr:NADP-dependent malic enzyme [Syntrophomonadaceae bacterium]
MPSNDERLSKANKPAEDALKLHPFYRGKMQTLPRCAVRSMDDFAIWYTPGVAAPCKEINKNKDLVYDYTCKWNTVAVISDGTRVLGLGDIGPEAAMPVMEGKALLFKYLGGVDAVPICLDTKDPDEFIQTVKYLQPSFGGVNLEDISSPKCFYILERLRNEMEIPVWHDDQQGTAAVTLAGLINALKQVGKKLDEVKIAMIGAGAANIRIAKVLIKAGVTPGNIYMTDVNGILNPERTDLKDNKETWELCTITNAEGRTGGNAEAIKGTDVVIALSAPGPGIIKKEWISTMADEAVVFACANPIPEIWPWEAKEAGARIVVTGRSDFPNQVNNSLGFPAIFRGALDVRAKTITDEMCIAAAYALANFAEEKGLLKDDYLLPTMEDWEAFPMEAAAVGVKAVEQGVARIERSYDELYNMALNSIKEAQEMTRLLMREGHIAKAPK